MKSRSFIITLLLFASIFFHACVSTGKSTSTVDDGDITARGAFGRLESASSGPLYTGNGGGNIRLAILAPELQGDVPGYLPLYIQGLLNNNINKFSAINLIDRQNLNRIINEQNLAASGRFSDRDFISIGDLTNAQYFLFGTIQRLSGNQYSLQLSITESTTGVLRANFMKNGTLAQLEGRGMLLNEATAELLEQMGVQLTEAGRQELLAGSMSAVQAEAGLARGITAQAGGDEVEALFNFAQAVSFDPSQLEALSRLNTLSTTISDGTISQRILNDLQARDRWIEAFKETTRFFNEHPPFEIIFDPNLIQVGETDFAKRTATLGMKIRLNPSEAGFGALNALIEGLEKTDRRGAWGFSGWPFMDISPRTAGTVVFSGKRSFSYKVDVALINENNKTLGKSSVTLNTAQIRFSSGDKNITPPFRVDSIASFPDIKAEDLTPTLTIVIIAVNGIRTRNLITSGYMRIEPGDLELRIPVAEEQRVLENNTARKPTVPSNTNYLLPRIGYNYLPSMPLGATLGFLGFYTSWNFIIPAWQNYGQDKYLSYNLNNQINVSKSSNYIDKGDRAYEEFEWTAGCSIDLFRGWVLLTLGAGANHRREWRLFETLNNLGNIASTKWYGPADWSLQFVLEAGLNLVFNKFYLSGTYRSYKLFEKHGFSLGAGFFGP